MWHCRGMGLLACLFLIRHFGKGKGGRLERVGNWGRQDLQRKVLALEVLAHGRNLQWIFHLSSAGDGGLEMTGQWMQEKYFSCQYHNVYYYHCCGVAVDKVDHYPHNWTINKYITCNTLFLLNTIHPQISKLFWRQADIIIHIFLRGQLWYNDSSMVTQQCRNILGLRYGPPKCKFAVIYMSAHVCWGSILKKLVCFCFCFLKHLRSNIHVLPSINYYWYCCRLKSSNPSFNRTGKSVTKK